MRARSKGYHKKILPNGIRVIGEEIPGFNSVTVGIFVFCGSRDEPSSDRGIAHFTEHMLFKGTERRSSLDISKEIDGVGGIINAYTNKEYTCYYVKVVQDKLELALDVLSDIFLNSTIKEEELDKEKTVVVQEIGMVNDTPDDVIHDLLLEALFGKECLGFSILGTEETVKNFNREKILSFIDNFYLNDRIIIAAAGNLRWDDFFEKAKYYFGYRSSKKINFPERKNCSEGQDISIKKDHLYQTNTAIGFKTVSRYSNDYYPIRVLNSILGSSMSSYLFQELREKTGYAYSVFSLTQSYQDTGFLEVFYATAPKNNNFCLDKVKEILDRFKNGKISESELNHTKEQIKGYIMLSQDSSDARFSYNAKVEMYHNEYIPLEKELEKIYQVTLDDIVRVANEYLIFDKAKIVTITPK